MAGVRSRAASALTRDASQCRLPLAVSVENVWIPAFAVAGGRYRTSELETIPEPHAPPSHQALRRLRLGQGPRGLDQAAPEAEEAARREAGAHPHHAHG